MVFVKVRETYDLHTTKNKMTVIGIHTPKPDIIKKNYPGLLMQCKAYRPVSADVRIACASMLPLDPQGIGTSEGDVAPEDVFNPILYKAMSNKGMSQLEARINYMSQNGGDPNLDVDGISASVEVNGFTTYNDEFPIYYGLLSNTHDWKHANPQAGLAMTGLKPLVYEILYNVGDNTRLAGDTGNGVYRAPGQNGSVVAGSVDSILGSAKPLPFMNCTSYTLDTSGATPTGISDGGFNYPAAPSNAEQNVPWIKVFCGCIIVPPSRLHELYYRMVVEWTIEFSQLRPIGEITDFNGLVQIGNATHFQNYSYESTKSAVTGTDESMLDSDSCMASANVDINKVM